jgi:hypothetical protein
LFIVRAREIFESREPTETAAARRDLEKAETRYERAEALLVVERETRVKNTETALDREQAARREIAELKLALVAASDAEQRAEARLTTRAQHQNANQDLTRMGNYPGQNQFISAPHNPAAHGTFELMRQHATRTSALIANQEAMIAELRRELMLAMEADVLGDGQSSFENEPPLELESVRRLCCCSRSCFGSKRHGTCGSPCAAHKKRRFGHSGSGDRKIGTRIAGTANKGKGKPDTGAERNRTRNRNRKRNARTSRLGVRVFGHRRDALCG